MSRDAPKSTEPSQRLLNQNRRLVQAIENISDYGIFLLDINGHVLTWNQGARNIKGYEDVEIIGKHFSIFYTEKDRSTGYPQYELEEAIKKGRYEDEGWRVRKDGTKFWANVIITKSLDDRGAFVGFSKVTRDLTEKMLAEKKLRESHDNLEDIVQKRTSDLEKAVRSRDEFLSIASHELKTPMTSLKMQMQILKNKFDIAKIPDLEKLTQGFENGLKQVDRLTALIDNLLDVARAQSSKLAFYFETFELVQFTKDVVASISDQLILAGSPVEVHGEKVELTADRFRLEQVFINLLTNAMKYAPKAPIKISIVTTDSSVRIMVKDLGPGIPDTLKPKIFDRFESIGKTRKMGGLGLGLFICREIIRGHQGQISIESESGNGSVFIIELPLIH